MPSKACDPQQDALHEAEREFYPKRKGRPEYVGGLSLSLARDLVEEVRRLYELPPVYLTYKRQPHSSAGAYTEFDMAEAGDIIAAYITFTGVNVLSAHTLLHELAHVVTDDVFGDGLEHHGPEFVGVMSWLFERFQIIPADAFGLILRRHGVRRRPARFCSPEMLCKLRAKKG